MIKIIGIFALFCLLPIFGAAQEAGGRVYGDGDRENRARRQPNLPASVQDSVSGEPANQTIVHYQFIDAKIVSTVSAKEYIAVFGLSQEAPTVVDANRKIDAQVERFRQSLTALGVNLNDTYVDFITQNRVYDYVVKGGTAREKNSGFQIKKNFSVRYQDRKLLEKMTTAAAQTDIFDLIKVDYIVGDMTATRTRLADEAAKVLKQKEAAFTKMGVKLEPITVSLEQFDIFQPHEAYNSYKAFESGDVDNVYRTVEKRKNSTFYFEPLNEGKFDAVIMPIGASPEVQCTYYVRMKYFVSSRTTIIIDPAKQKP